MPQQRRFVPATAPARTSRSFSTATVPQEEESFSFPAPAADSNTTATEAAAAPTKKQKKEPRRRTTLETKDPLLITPAAAIRIQELLAGDNAPDAPIGIRLGVKRRGCNGLSYTLNYATEIPAKDIAMESHGVKVFIEPMALFSIVGTTMDWEETELASEFTFSNPNSKGECGCGESFNV
jgi:iron-sulfur cluster assembly accessory protein